MIEFAVLVVLLSLVAGTAAAQSRVYGGGTVAIDSGSRGAYDTLGTSFPAAGGFIGFRFHDAWSMEVHGDRAFAESPERETVISIFERYAVRDRAGNGFAVLAVWKARRQSRVGAAVTMGIAMRGFRTERVSTKRLTRTMGIPWTPAAARPAGSSFPSSSAAAGRSPRKSASASERLVSTAAI